MNAHTKLVRSCLQLVEALPYAHAWKNGSGRVQVATGDGKARYFQTGERGAADIAVLVEAEPHAVPLFAECKTGSGKQSMDQRAWQERVESLGAVYIVVRHPIELKDAIEWVRKVTAS